MNRLLAYLVLPTEISGFERRYLERMTHIGLLSILAHVPVMMLVAYLSGTGVKKALVFTLFVAAGPALAARVLSNPRAVARLFAVASMSLSALIVHFGQGEMQIEMHFHFFVSIALLAVFADPLVVVIAAATAASHHVVVWLLFPSSIFNHEAALGTVLVHALFVVVESVAACFVARSFHDNVIGLDRIVGQRTVEVREKSERMRLVLDNVNDGLATVDLRGCVASEQSGALARHLGPSVEGEHLWDWLARSDARFGASVEVFWGMLVEGALPLELALDQLPKRLVRERRVLDLAYKPLFENDSLSGVLLVVTDSTSEVDRERAETEQHDAMALFERARDDRSGLTEFLLEGNVIAQTIADASRPLDEVRRAIHTLKGNSGLCGLASIVELTHAVESRIEETGELLTVDRSELLARWAHVASNIAVITDTNGRGRIEIEETEHREALERIRGGATRERIAELVESWSYESAQTRLTRLGKHAERLAARLGKGPIDIVTAANGVRFVPGDLRAVWSSLTHVVRNAVDHGVEPADVRRSAGKSERATIVLTTRIDGDELVVSVADDGRGVDWDAVKRKADACGLPSENHADLERALFADGLSTRDDATDLSGRGLGMGAVLEACARSEGSIRMTSELGLGTTVELRLGSFRGVSVAPPHIEPAAAPTLEELAEAS